MAQFLVPTERAELRRILQAPNNLDWLLTFLCRYVRDFLLEAFPPPDPPKVTAHLIRRIGEALHEAVLEKLKHDHPKDCHRAESVLVRTYPDRAGRLLDQALCYLGDCWIEDYSQHPRDSLAARCQRLLPSLARLPKMQGKSAAGTYHQLFFLMIYDIALEVIPPLPRIGRIPTEKVLQRRRGIFHEIFSRLPKLNDPRQSRGFFHPLTGEIFFEVSEEDYEHWFYLPKHEIALEVAVRAVKTRHRLTPAYLRRILPKLRTLARRLDQGLKHS